MKASRMLISTLKEAPNEAKIDSHILLLRAGMVKNEIAGVYNYLPLGLRVLNKIENIIKEEMDNSGALEILCSAIQPKELWVESGRWMKYGPELMRLKGKYPKDICLICDVHVKHTFEIVSQPLDFTIESIKEGGADALICTGISTGKSPSIEDVEKMKELSDGLPVILGSGVNSNTVKDYLAVSDGAIIGSYLKEDGVVENPVSLDRVKLLMANVK